MGILLNIPIASLNTIEYDNAYKASRCCNAMLEKWLEIDSTATWKKLFFAVECITTFSTTENGISSNIVYIICTCVHSVVMLYITCVHI